MDTLSIIKLIAPFVNIPIISGLVWLYIRGGKETYKAHFTGVEDARKALRKTALITLGGAVALGLFIPTPILCFLAATTFGTTVGALVGVVLLILFPASALMTYQACKQKGIGERVKMESHIRYIRNAANRIRKP